MTTFAPQMVIHHANPLDWLSAQKWAQAEQWDLGKDDARHFFAVDPKGFFLGDLEQQAVAAISVANFDSHYAHLGHYLVDPAWRGKGLGLQLWQAATEHAGERCIGLDGMPEQVNNYQRSGFVTHYRTLRISGHPQLRPESETVHLPIDVGMLTQLIEWDSTIVGYSRSQLLSNWFSGAGRWGFWSQDDRGINGMIGIRQSDAGYRIGPLHAANSEVMTGLMGAALSVIPPTGCVTLDVPDYAEDIVQLCQDLGLQVLFHTHRMYRGTPPQSEPGLIKALASLELG